MELRKDLISLWLDNAATASQCAALLDDDAVREAIILNVINPLLKHVGRAEMQTEYYGKASDTRLVPVDWLDECRSVLSTISFEETEIGARAEGLGQSFPKIMGEV